MIYRLNGIPTNIPASFFVEIDKLVLKFLWKCKGPRKAKTIWGKKNKVRGLILPDFKTDDKATIVKTVWCCPKDRHINQRKNVLFGRVQKQNPIYAQLIFNKDARQFNGERKDCLFNKLYWDSLTAPCKRMKLDPLLHSTYKS